MSSATHLASGKAEEISRQNALGKRRCPDEGVEVRKCLKDAELLDCPVCLKSVDSRLGTRLIYQCQNGHIACYWCCKKLPQPKKCPTCSQPTGSIRCISLEKILDSMQLSCQYASHGCKDQSNKTSDILDHERDCWYEPIPCPFAECDFKGSRTTGTMPLHLAKVHEVPTVEYNNVSGAGFTMQSEDRLVMVKLEEMESVERTDLIFVHRGPLHEDSDEVEPSVFFCTTLETRGFECFDLKVKYHEVSFSHSAESRTTHLRTAGQYLKKDYLLLPLGSCPPHLCDAEEQPIKVHLKVTASFYH